ncbi:hypothetical protein CKO42_07185 [Lamprobacter modestohalophilus]|uniref:Uncharacterized protein n=1 Tax=Lamprobacter modestohalophilus TaxID=1064514 RepID=A0A9X0W8I1_9GAMM|nr:hypothetical protein [Lamprobacter modestohalophilus]
MHLARRQRQRLGAQPCAQPCVQPCAQPCVQPCVQPCAQPCARLEGFARVFWKAHFEAGEQHLVAADELGVITAAARAEQSVGCRLSLRATI